ncbi:MAG TPA: copper amine oxidase N-terminal domain-containing protein [Symbiobacteriaceae bacterium]|nr:copper amine oxidase N-terminal domain-containing protein [Symbiobacteriaceae bacterium]
MRKIWVGLALAGLMVASAAAGAWAAVGVRKSIEVEYRGIKITVDGNTVNTGTDEPFLYVEKSRTYVPARYVAEALGANVGWNDQTSTVEISTANYVKVTTDGEYKIWAMPGQGFSIKAPRGFTRLDLGAAMLQLALPDPTSGSNAIVAVTRNDPPGDGSTLRQRADTLISGLSQTFLTGAKVTAIRDEGTRLTAEGTSTIFGQGAANFTLRLIASPKGDWLLLTLAPSTMQTQLAPVMKDILDSFTLTQ